MKRRSLSDRTFCLVAAVLFPAIALSSCSGGKDSGMSVSASLLAELSGMASQGKVAYAHQDDLVYGHSWVVTDIDVDPIDRSDIKSVCGDYPYMVGFDLGGIELGDDSNLDGVPFNLMRKAALAHISRGGAVTFSWHLRNPLTGGDAWDVSSDRVVASILEGGEKHGLFMEWLQRLGDFLSSLKDADGNPVPVIFRPYHENVGSWFWWGGGLCTPDQYKDLFAMTYDYLVVERGLDNLLWVYSPNSGVSPEEYTERYPGDDIVDILGVDHYEYVDTNAEIPEDKRLESGNAYFQEVLRKDLSFLEDFSSEHGKLMALSETGFESTPYKKWWTEVLLPVLKEYPVTYLLTWRNAHNRPEHYFAPFPGSGDEEDFVSFHADPVTVFLPADGR